MPSCRLLRHLILRPVGLVLVGLGLVLSWCSAAQSQLTGLSNVGGVAIDADGMLTNATVDEMAKFRSLRTELFKADPGVGEKTAMRKISLRRLDAAIGQCVENGQPLPEEIAFLAGLQRIDYVLVYPEQQDIVLVGPAEGWKVDAKGNVVGATTGRPVMLLDDLVVALRAAMAPVRTTFSCSIDPTPEGLQRLSAFAKTLQTIGNPQRTGMAVAEKLGPQRITIGGVPATSRFARVMVAADYRMKRVSMDLEPAPVTGLPSFVQMIKASGHGMRNMLPRWWLAPDYEPLLRDEEGLSWQLRGGNVRTMAEKDFVTSAGLRQRTERADPISQRWADLFTARYDELSLAEPIFGQLRNCMDLAVVAALIAKENLTAKAGTSLPMLLSPGGLETLKLPVPKQIASEATVVHKGRKWIIAAGGVMINPWEIVEKSEASPALNALRKATLADTDHWWFD